MKKLVDYIMIGLLLFGLLLFMGCTPKQEKISTQTSSLPKDFTVAISGTFPPFGFIGKDGNPNGFEIDLMNEIAKAEGVKFTYQVSSWEGKMPALLSKQVDILMCSMTITDERKKEVDFSDPYFESTNYLLVPEDSDIKTVNELKGKAISVLESSTSDFAISNLLGKEYEGIRRFKHTTAALLELRNRKVDASIGDSGIILYYLKMNPETKLKLIKDTGFPKEYYGMATRKGDKETMKVLNGGLIKVKENGKYDEIYNKWFNN